MPQANKDYQVIIVGAGPVGLGLAIELGQRGVRCILVERYPDVQPIPKGQNLTQRTMEHMAAWGCEPQLRAARTIPSNYGIGGLIAYRTFVSGYAYDWMQRSLVGQYYAQANERLPQFATEAVLRARAAELDTVEILYGWTFEDIAQDETGATVEIVQRDGTKQTITADYAVGCDGARSLVRDKAGLTQTRQDHDRLMVLLVFKSKGLHELLGRFPGKSFYCVLNPEHKGYWQFFGRVDLGTTWFFHAPVPLGTTKDNFDFKAYVHASAGAEFDVEFDHIGFWELRIALADDYRKGRVFIAGDAAHSHPPYGGYGVNTGFEDAANLGWKLAAALKGWGGEGLLDSYDAERRPVFASTARDFIAKSIETDRAFLETYDPEVDRDAFETAWAERQTVAVSEVNIFEPNYGGSPIVWPQVGEPSALGEHMFKARAGHHLAPRPLSDGRSDYEVLGDDFTLLAFGAEPHAVRAFEEAADMLGVPLKVVIDSADGGRELYEAELVLVRPDQFVAWAGGGAPDAAQILKRAIGSSATSA